MWDNVHEINYLSHSWNENTWDKLIFYFLKWKKSAIVAVRSRALAQACAMLQCQIGLLEIPLEISVICSHKKLMW